MAEDRTSDRVHARLRHDVLRGVLAPGDKLPSERALAAELGVNRHGVREALKRLEQAGLVSITQGGPTRVREWTRTGGLELLLDLVAPSQDQPPDDLARGILEMRASIGVDAARRCAERGSEEQRAVVLHAAELAAAAAVEGDATVAYAVLWEAVVVGSGNLAYRLSLNSLVEALAGHEELLARTLPGPGDAEAIGELGRAVAAGEADAAAESARALLEDDAGD